MITVTLQFNTADEALAALKKLEGTAADPVSKPGKPAKQEAPAPTPPTAAQAAAPETKGEPSEAKPIDFKADIAPKFLDLAKLPGGSEKQAAVVKHFGVDRLSQVDKTRYQEVLDKIAELAA